MTFAAKSPAMFSMKCGMPSFHATRFASVRSSIVQQPPYVESAFVRLSYICIDRPTTSCPADLRMYAAVDESTPPDMATATFTAHREAPVKSAKFRKGTCCACLKSRGPDWRGSSRQASALRTGRRRRSQHPQDDRGGA